MFVDAHIIILYTGEGNMTEGLRTESNRIAYGVRLDSVRDLIRFRTMPDQIPFGVR